MIFNQSSESLKSMWPAIKSHPQTVYKITLDRTVEKFNFDQDMYDFLSYLKLINTHKTKFDDAVNALIVFSNVCIKNDYATLIK